MAQASCLTPSPGGAPPGAPHASLSSPVLRPPCCMPATEPPPATGHTFLPGKRCRDIPPCSRMACSYFQLRCVRQNNNTLYSGCTFHQRNPCILGKHSRTAPWGWKEPAISGSRLERLQPPSRQGFPGSQGAEKDHATPLRFSSDSPLPEPSEPAVPRATLSPWFRNIPLLTQLSLC